jgi:DNA gyrase/topoisomerase IV subunit A
LLRDQDKREDLIIADLAKVAKEYGDKRKTEIRGSEEVRSIDPRSISATSSPKKTSMSSPPAMAI